MKAIKLYGAIIQPIIGICISFLLVSVALAKEINLYEQPQMTAKVVGQIDLSAGVIPIFTPQGSEWVKVADPRNGNVGWIKSADMSGPDTTVSFTQHMLNDGKGPQGYQIIRLGQPEKMSNAQAQQMIQKMQTQQQAIQQSLQKAYQNMLQDLDTLFQGQFPRATQSNSPVIMPIVIIPGQQQQQGTHPATPLTKPTPANTKAGTQPTLPKP